MSLSCLCCKKGLPVQDRRVCPECSHIFQGNGWDGIDAHWRAKHESHIYDRPFAKFHRITEP